MAPAAAEILDRLGAADRIVGVGDFVDWPPQVARLPKVGAYDSPSIERVLALRANLLFTARGRAGGAVHARLARLGVRVVPLDTDTYRGVLQSIATVGRLVKRQEAARAEISRIRGSLAEVRRRVHGAPRRRVLAVVGRDPLFVAGPGSHLDELIEVAGGANVAADARAPFQLVSLEAALERRPEVVVDLSDNRPGAPRGCLAGAWGRWPFLPAVREKRVWWVDPVRLAIPGPRLPEMAQLMAKLVHPEVFGVPLPEELGPLRSADLAGALGFGPPPSPGLSEAMAR